MNSGCQYVVFQMESLSDRDGFVRGNSNYLNLLKQASGVWDYNEANRDYLGQHGCKNVAHIPIGYSTVLERIRHSHVSEKDIDVLFCGAMNERRRKVVQALRDSGMKVEAPFGVYGQARDQWIARAKIVLNLHQFETTQLETVRVSYLLNNRCFVISESSDSNPYDDGVVFASYGDLVDCCQKYLSPGMDAERERIAQLGYDSLKSIPMLQQLKSALAQHEIFATQHH